MTPSGIPTDLPSSSPTISFAPTGTPSASPTAHPSTNKASEKDTDFRQEFQVGNGREFTDEQLFIIETLYRGYTKDFAPISEEEVKTQVITTCTVNRQVIPDSGTGRLLSENGFLPLFLRRRRVQDDPTTDVVLNLDYTMKYESRYHNVTTYPRRFQNWTNTNLETVLQQMQILGLNVTQVDKASRIVVSTPAPSASEAPSFPPTVIPTKSFAPTLSAVPTEGATIIPSIVPSSKPDGHKTVNVVLIVVSIIIALAIIAIGLFIYYRKRKKTREMELQADAIKNKQGRDVETNSGRGWVATTGAASKLVYDKAESSEAKAYGSTFGKHSNGPSGLDDVGDVVSPNGSLVSNQSLLSRGNSMGGDSRDEADTTQIFADEFDQYKDQNLEKMRADIEGNLEGCDGMMSQAVARALIDEDDLTVASDFLWGGGEGVTGPEIEASALGIITDWLKRNDKASAREK